MEPASLDKFDEVDLRIINLLQEDSRLSFSKIANKLGISVGTAFNRTKNLKKKGILKGYTVVVDPVKLGYAMIAIMLIQAEGAHLLEVENEIAKIDNVAIVYDITGDFDIAVTVRFKNKFDLNVFVKKLLTIPYVKRTVTNVVLNVVKEDFKVKVS